MTTEEKHSKACAYAGLPLSERGSLPWPAAPGEDMCICKPREYENGLVRIGNSSVRHLINPNPTRFAPYCKPHGTVGTLHATKGTETDCGRCIAKRDAQARRVAS